MIADIYVEPIQVVHEDERRKIQSLHLASEGGLANIVDGEVALFTIRDPDVVLGNHFYDYDEFLACLSGQGTLILENIHTQKRRELDFRRGNKVYIPKETAIALRAEPGTQILVIREQELSPDTTHPYDMGER